MGEHHFYFDHYEVYETTAHVPLIIRYSPAVPNKTRIKGLVQSTISLEPTILNLFGIKIPDQLEGKNLIKLAIGEEKPWREIYVNQGLWTAQRAIRTERWKLIRTIDPAYWEIPEIVLYDMQDDPEETKNLVLDRPEIVDKFELKMERWLRRELGKRIDPLEQIANLGLPSRVWVERAARREVIFDKYEEWRARIDRAENLNALE